MRRVLAWGLVLGVEVLAVSRLGVGAMRGGLLISSREMSGERLECDERGGER